MLDIQLGGVVDQVPVMTAELAGMLPPAQIETLAVALEHVYAFDSLAADVRAYYLEHYDPRLADVLAWMKQPEIAEMWARHRAFNEAHGDIVDSLATAYYSSTPPDSAQQAEVEQYIDALGARAYYLETALGVTVVLVRGLATLEGQEIPAAGLAMMRQAMTQEMAPLIDETVHQHFWYMLQHEPAEDTASLQAFYETDLGQWFTAAYTAAQAYAFAQAGERLVAYLQR